MPWRNLGAVAACACLTFGCAQDGTRQGFITTARRDGRWMFVAPDGKEFRAHGVDWITYEGFKDAKTGRSPYREANDAAYGGDRNRWAADTVARLKKWGFNSLGCSNSPEVRHRGLFHPSFVQFSGFWRSGTNTAERLIGPRFPNVFHPEWESYCDRLARETCVPQSQDREVIGWFFGNELHWWGSGRGVWKFGLFRDASILPDTHPAKQALLDFCGGTTNVPDAVKTDFIRLCAERYFSVTCNAIRRYDPNHLVLGCRFMGWEGGAIPEVWDVAAKYCDVISFNQYPRFTNGVIRVRSEPFTNAIARLARWTGDKPLMISEWSFMARDSGLPCAMGCGQVFSTQRERAAAVTGFLEQIDNHPNIIGNNFFMWVDEPAGGLASGATGENGNYGLVNAAGTPYAAVVDVFRSKRVLQLEEQCRKVPPGIGSNARSRMVEDIASFNRTDNETVTNAIPNAAAAYFLLANAPCFECPDRAIERAYNFRWWTYRKHLRHGTGRWTVSEFLPDVGWAGKDNSIVCAAGHHFREGRWLRNPQFMEDLARFWLSDKNPDVRRWGYSSWLFTSVRETVKVSGHDAFVCELLPDAVRYYEQWEKGMDYRLYGRDLKGKVPFRMGLAGKGLFTSVDNHEGTEITLSGSGYRPLFNAAMWSEAASIAAVAREVGDTKLAKRFSAKADAIAAGMKRELWDGSFFVAAATNFVRTGARELHGYAPWYFGMPLGVEYDRAFTLLADGNGGFRSPRGLTFPERRTPGFTLSCDWHECFWNGPVWPYATSIALTALANRLQRVPAPQMVDATLFVSLLHDYAASHVLEREDGVIVPWIDESQHPDTGEWITRTLLREKARKGGKPFFERGKDYNHSTFCDLVISGLVGFVPQQDGKIVLRPLFPETWDYLALENIRYHGRDVSIYWDRTGSRYGHGKGFSVFVDGILEPQAAVLATLAK